jgi:hypothetical protein
MDMSRSIIVFKISSFMRLTGMSVKPKEAEEERIIAARGNSAHPVSYTSLITATLLGTEPRMQRNGGMVVMFVQIERKHFLVADMLT